MNDKASLHSALKGAYAVFAVTDFWDTMSADVETQQGTNIADVSKEEGVQHLLWSYLVDVKKRLSPIQPLPDLILFFTPFCL